MENSGRNLAFYFQTPAIVDCGYASLLSKERISSKELYLYFSYFRRVNSAL